MGKRLLAATVVCLACLVIPALLSACGGMQADADVFGPQFKGRVVLTRLSIYPPSGT
jgi:hypothetical protein